MKSTTPIEYLSKDGTFKEVHTPDNTALYRHRIHLFWKVKTGTGDYGSTIYDSVECFFDIFSSKKDTITTVEELETYFDSDEDFVQATGFYSTLTSGYDDDRRSLKWNIEAINIDNKTLYLYNLNTDTTGPTRLMFGTVTITDYPKPISLLK